MNKPIDPYAVFHQFVPPAADISQQQYLAASTPGVRGEPLPASVPEAQHHFHSPAFAQAANVNLIATFIPEDEPHLSTFVQAGG